MKKLWMIAVVACATLLVGCASLESKAKNFAEDLFEAELANDETAYDKADSEIEEYIKTLPNEAEIDKFEELLEKEYEALLQAHIAEIEKDAAKYAKDFIKAMKNGDEDKAEKVLEEAEKHCMSLPDMDQALFSEAFIRRAYTPADGEE